MLIEFEEFQVESKGNFTTLIAKARVNYGDVVEGRDFPSNGGLFCLAGIVRQLIRASGWCTNCHERKGTVKWAGTEMMMAIRGHYTMWCKLCCTREQVRYAELAVASLPRKREELAIEEAFWLTNNTVKFKKESK
jgi:hypothetical protein